MAADASIYNLVQPQQQDAGQNMYRNMQIRDLMQKREREEADFQAQQQRQTLLKSLFQNGQPTAEQVMAVDPEMGMKYQDYLQGQGKAKGESESQQLDILTKKTKIYRDTVASAQGPQDLPRIREVTAQLFGPDAAAGFDDPTFQFTPEWQQSQVRDSDSFLEQMKPDYQTVSAGGQTVMRQMNPQAPGFSTEPIQHTPTPKAPGEMGIEYGVSPQLVQKGDKWFERVYGKDGTVQERPIEGEPLRGMAYDSSRQAEIAGSKAAATVEGKALGEAEAELADREASYSRLDEVVFELSELGKKATYTRAGQVRDTVKRELGMDVGEGAVARAEYISKIDNEILPLLRQTFGAQFTQKEGESLKATLGDPNKSPAEKDAVLRSFIATKKAQIETLQKRTGRTDANVPQVPQEKIDALLKKYGRPR